MASETASTGADSQSAADLEAVLGHVIAGTPVDSELSRRVRVRSERMTEELRRRYGEVDAAVSLIREARQ